MAQEVNELLTEADQRGVQTGDLSMPAHDLEQAIRRLERSLDALAATQDRLVDAVRDANAQTLSQLEELEGVLKGEPAAMEEDRPQLRLAPVAA